MKSILRIIDGTSLAFMWVSIVMTWLMVIVVFCGVVARYFFNTPIHWVPEFSQFLFGASFMIASAHVLKIDGHVRIDIFVQRMSRRARAMFECFSSSAFWIFSMVLLYKGFEMAMRSLKNLETSGTYWDPPVYPIKIVIPFAAALLMIQGFAQLVRNINASVKGNESWE